MTSAFQTATAEVESSNGRPHAGERVRLLVLTPSLTGGGLDRFVAILLGRLDKTAVASTLGLLHLHNMQDAFPVQLPSSVPVVDFRKQSPLELWQLVRRIASYFDQQHPDVVLGVTTYCNLLLLAARRLSHHKPRVIATEHVDPARSLRGMRRRWQAIAARRLYPDAQAVVTVSKGQRSSIIRQFQLSPDRVITIHNAFDPAVDADIEPMDAQLRLNSVHPTIVYVGHLVQHKGVSYLLQAVAHVRRRFPVQLLLVGEGEQLASLRKLASELGIADAVDFAGFLPKPFRLMAGADVFAFPSLSEAFPLALLEAARSGAAIVASDCDYGPAEMFEDGQSALLVPPGNVAALARAIERVLTEPGLAGRLRSGARAASARFSPEKMVESYQALITQAAPHVGATTSNVHQPDTALRG